MADKLNEILGFEPSVVIYSSEHGEVDLSLKAPQPTPVVAAEPEPVVPPQPEPVVEQPAKQPKTIAAIPIEEPEKEPEPDPLPKPVPVQMPSQSVFQINDPNVTPASEEIEEPKYDMHGSCPKCGSTFVSAKKSAGLFGGTKIKYVCSACKHKF